MKQELLTVRAPCHPMLVIVVVLCVVYFALFVFIPCLVRNVAYVCVLFIRDFPFGFLKHLFRDINFDCYYHTLEM